MKKRLGDISRAVGIALLIIAIIVLIRWHPAWAIWVAVGFFGFNVLLIVLLAIGETILLRRARRKAADSTIVTEADEND